MKIVDLKAQVLDEEEFKDYGKILDSDNVKADAEECDFQFYYNLIEADFHNPVAISVVKSKIQDDLYGNSLETHFQTPEVLAPLDGIVYVIVAKTDSNDKNKPDLSTAKAFIVKPGQAVLLNSGTWHRSPLSTDKPVKTLCLVREGTPTDNITYYLQDTYGIRFRVVR